MVCGAVCHLDLQRQVAPTYTLLSAESPAERMASICPTQSSDLSLGLMGLEVPLGSVGMMAEWLVIKGRAVDIQKQDMKTNVGVTREDSGRGSPW